MTILFSKTRLLVLCLALSVLTHILVVYAVRMFGTYDFTTPIALSQVVAVDLTKSVNTPSSPVSPVGQENGDTNHSEKDPDSADGHDVNAPPSNPEQHQPTPAQTDSPAIGSHIKSSEAPDKPSPAKSRQSTPADLKTALLSNASNFLSTKSEKLTYVISMLGLPIGNAELEAKNENGEIWLTLRIKSNAGISSFYSVDDLIETRHIVGSFIIAKIKQQEGSFKGDTRFTIFQKEKSVFWINRITNRSQTEAIPTEEALDTLSGIYFLRNRQLQVGKTETLHIYDSESYADVPVEILRRETVRLPNLTTVNTLVVQPLQKSAGLFRRTGDVLIWMTDDENKVPVKIVTSVALGTVTVELVSAETTPLKEAVMKK
jgi:hypothetical protein